MLSPKSRRNIYRVIPFGVIWWVFSVIFLILEKGLLADLGYYPSTGNPYNFAKSIFITPFAALITGFLIGTIEIIFFNKWFMRKSFGLKILYKTIFNLVIVVLFLFVTSAFVSSLSLQVSFFNLKVWENVRTFAFSFAFLSVIIYITAMIIVSQFYTEISESIGHGLLHNFFTGKYHRPLEEERIYMFLDMRSSTTIAERLGHLKYFEMLREYYADLSESIMEHDGEIYQYVGDEVVVSWKLARGLNKNNCLECFFAMKKALCSQEKKYLSNYGLLPQFKAGLHCGKVTTGEIGVIKKEIIFTGDVLNTTARIQMLCNSYGVDIIISGELLHKLKPDQKVEAKSLGENVLRGKDKRIELYAISKV
jgi:adenylate cyclase